MRKLWMMAAPVMMLGLAVPALAEDGDDDAHAEVPC